MEDTIKELKKQHLNNYKKAILEIIENNTNALVNEDIKSLITKPPLDSMDTLKNKLIQEAKKDDLILNILELNKLLDKYHISLEKCLDEIKIIRIKELSKIINNYKLKDNETISLYKKDFILINKDLKHTFKFQLTESFEKVIIKDINKLFNDNKIKEELIKFSNSYHRQILDNFDNKILVKDNILINSVKETGERYLFTINNSRLLNID